MNIVHSDPHTDTLSYGDTVYTKGADGTFDVPHEIGQELVGFPHWSTAIEARAKAAEQQAADEVDPQQLAERIRDLEAADAERAAMADRIAELEALLAARGGSGEQNDAESPVETAADAPSEAPAKMTAAQKKAAAKAQADAAQQA